MKFTDMKSAVEFLARKTAESEFGDDSHWNVASGLIEKFEKNISHVTVSKKTTVSVHFKTAYEYDYTIFRFSDGRYRGCDYCSRFLHKREATEIDGYVDFMYTWHLAEKMIKSLL